MVALPPYSVETHNVFYVSVLREYIVNLDLMVKYEPLKIQEGLTYTDKLVKIMVLRKHHGANWSRTCGTVIRICLRLDWV